jgi:hypothetical protein
MGVCVILYLVNFVGQFTGRKLSRRGPAGPGSLKLVDLNK